MSHPKHALIIHSPNGPAAQLFLLFHGFGANKEDLEPLGERIADEFPQALVVSIDAPATSDFGYGRQWFSLAEISEDNRPARVVEALPAFLDRIREWQRFANLGPAATALVGFSQGGIMALEASLADGTITGRVVALSSRLAKLPDEAPETTTYHFFHGKADQVIPYGHTVSAAEHLISLGGDVTADVLPFIGHEINDEVLELMFNRLKTHVPKRIWDAAMRAQSEESPPH